MDEAIESYRHAIEIEPGLAAAYKEAAQLLQERGDLAGAEALANSLSAVDSAEGSILLARIFSRSEREGEAISILEGAAASLPDSAEVRIGLAARYISSGRMEDAERVLEDVLERVRPDSVPARMLLVESYRLSGKIGDMIRQLEELSSGRPDDSGVKLTLALALLDGDRTDDAEAIVLPMLETHPDSPWVRFVAGSALMARGDNEAAISHLEVAAELLPNQPVVGQRLELARARLRSTDRQLTGVGSQGPEGQTGTSPADWRTLWNSGRLYALLASRDSDARTDETLRAEALVLSGVFVGDLDLAKELASRLPADSPLHAYLNRVDSLGQQTLSAEDVSSLLMILEAWPPDDPDHWLFRQNAEGYLLARVGLRAQAFSKYGSIWDARRDNGVALRNLASMYQAIGMHRFAAKCLERLVRHHGAAGELTDLLIDAYRRAGMSAELRTFAESVYAISPEDPRAVVRLASIYHEDGETAVALQLLRGAADSVRALDSVKVALAVAYLHDGEPQSALDELAKVSDASTLNPHVLSTIRGFSFAQLGEPEQALAAVGGAVEGTEDATLRLLNAAMLIALDRDTEALSALPATQLLASTRQTARNALALALGAPESDAEVDPAMTAALRGKRSTLKQFALALAYWDARLDAQALELLNELMESDPGQSAYANATASILYRSPATPDRLALADALVRNYAELAGARLALAALQGKAGDREAQKASLLKAVELDPKSADGWNLLFRFAEETGDDALATECTARLLSIDPTDPALMNNFAYFHATTGKDVSAAVDYARKAFDARPSDSAVLHTLAIAQLRAGQYAEGARNLRLVLQTRPGDPTPSYDYGKLLVEQGQAEEGAEFIETAILYAENFGLEFPNRAEAERLLKQLKSQASEVL